jgi:hypothetical protein
MPPIEPPVTQSSFFMPSLSSSMAWARTMSRTVTSGKLRPYGSPVAGSTSAGPLDPMQPPMTLAQITKKRSVSMGLPGPTMVSHQPGLPVTGWALATN